jgi:hypothetical protein
MRMNSLILLALCCIWSGVMVAKTENQFFERMQEAYKKAKEKMPSPKSAFKGSGEKTAPKKTVKFADKLNKERTFERSDEELAKMFGDKKQLGAGQQQVKRKRQAKSVDEQLRQMAHKRQKVAPAPSRSVRYDWYTPYSQPLRRSLPRTRLRHLSRPHDDIGMPLSLEQRLEFLKNVERNIKSYESGEHERRAFNRRRFSAAQKRELGSAIGHIQRLQAERDEWLRMRRMGVPTMGYGDYRSGINQRRNVRVNQRNLSPARH